MLIGEYTHSFDAKSRISLPVRFRREIGRRVVITRGLDNCLFLYPLAEWKKISEKLLTLGMGQAGTRGVSRFLLSGAVEADVDTIGRILIPDFLKRFAGFSERVVFTGVGNRVELWDEPRWRQYKTRIEKQGDALAEKLGEVGML